MHVKEMHIFHLILKPQMQCWREMHNEELHKLYASTYITRVKVKENEIGGAYSTHGRDGKCVQNDGRKI
jgi:hypothetical protein